MNNFCPVMKDFFFLQNKCSLCEKILIATITVCAGTKIFTIKYLTKTKLKKSFC